jgi:glycine cleavage system H protein
MIPKSLKYSKDHEWISAEGKVGVTEYAQKELGDVVFVELPKIGKEIKVKSEIGVLESVKAVSNVYSPVAGKIVKINSGLTDKPELINSSPYENGWIAELEISDPGQLDALMNAADYQAYLNELHS